jgi:glycosyltransferase involved in cell wall biosynthesis
VNFSASDSPRLSIGLAVYNGERFLSQALACLLGQTFDDFEFIVCDNASTDKTREICLDHASRDARIRYYRNQINLGAAPNFNLAFSLSKAPFFKWAAHDDLHSASYLATCMDILDKNPDVVLAHSATTFVDEDGKAFPWDAANGTYVDPWTGAHQRPDSSVIGNSLNPVERFRQVLSGARWGTHMFGVIRRPVLQKTKLLRSFAGDDRALLAELALLGRFQGSPERLFLKRFHKDVSWALDQRELKLFLNTDGKVYSKRARQLQGFFSAPSNKPIGRIDRMKCTGVVALHCLKVFGAALAGKEKRIAAQRGVYSRPKL